MFRYDPSKFDGAYDIAHCLEHLLCGKRNVTKFSLSRTNAFTYFNVINFESFKPIDSLEYLDFMIKSFKDPVCFKDNKKLFRQEVFDRFKVGDKKKG